jgi:predicted negative regulator of RcsB-dependent stress response
MANEHLDDHELGELVKKWIMVNGPAIVVGIVLGAVGLSGWRFWESYQLDAKFEAARDYQQLVSELEGDDAQATTARLSEFSSENRNPGYQGLAALQLASKAVEDRNLEEAAQLYRVAIESAEPKALRQVAGLRLARVQLQAGQLEEARITVDRFDVIGFKAMAAQIRGDILHAQGDRDGAREAYQLAIDNGSSNAAVLQMKVDDLAPLVVSEEPLEPEATEATEDNNS